MEVLTEVNAVRPAIRVPKRQDSNWTSFASGRWGTWNLWFTADGNLTVEAWIDTGDGQINKTLFDEVHADAATWVAEAGQPLTWDYKEGRRSCQVRRQACPGRPRQPSRARSAEEMGSQCGAGHARRDE